MPDISLLAVGIATLVAFGLGGAHYAMLGEQLATVSQTAARAEQTAPWQLAVELARCLVLAATVAGLAAQADVDGPGGGLVLGLARWVSFPLVLWTARSSTKARRRSSLRSTPATGSPS